MLPRAQSTDPAHTIGKSSRPPSRKTNRYAGLILRLGFLLKCRYAEYVVNTALLSEEIEPFAYSAEVSGRKVRNREKPPPFIGGQSCLEIPPEKLNLYSSVDVA